MNMLRPVALIAAIVGAAGSVAAMLSVGQRNTEIILLILLFVGWVASPFVGLLIADFFGRRWSNLTRVTLHWLMLALVLGSLAIYAGVASGPQRSKPAATFLLVPLASWLIIAVSLSVSARVSRRRSHRVAE